MKYVLFRLTESGALEFRGGRVEDFKGAQHHIAAAYDGTHLRTYVDGKKVCS